MTDPATNTQCVIVVAAGSVSFGGWSPDQVSLHLACCFVIVRKKEKGPRNARIAVE